MDYDFDAVIDRRGTSSVKYDLTKQVFGDAGVLPMWVADMDFPVANFILEAISERIKHPVLGYTFRSESFSNSVVSWMLRRHAWEIGNADVCFSPGIVPALNMCVMEFPNRATVSWFSLRSISPFLQRSVSIIGSWYITNW